MAVLDRLFGAAFLESRVGSDHLAVLLGRRVEIARVEVEERDGAGAATPHKRRPTKFVMAIRLLGECTGAVEKSVDSRRKTDGHSRDIQLPQGV